VQSLGHSPLLQAVHHERLYLRPHLLHLLISQPLFWPLAFPVAALRLEDIVGDNDAVFTRLLDDTLGDVMTEPLRDRRPGFVEHFPGSGLTRLAVEAEPVGYPEVFVELTSSSPRKFANWSLTKS